jgi:hypothetical protein
MATAKRKAKRAAKLNKFVKSKTGAQTTASELKGLKKAFRKRRKK